MATTKCLEAAWLHDAVGLGFGGALLAMSACLLVLAACAMAKAFLCFRWLIHGRGDLIMVSIAVNSLTRGWSSLSVHCRGLVIVKANS